MLLGYKKGEGGILVIDETQAPTVRLIYQLFLDGIAVSYTHLTLPTIYSV